ncbi:MAG: MiaB/RimO family radical SAM methylthiotransferase [Bacteroidales bacterium]
MKYHLVTLGCHMNQSDSEKIKIIVEKMGYKWTDREEEASLLGIIACSVRQKAIDVIYTKIQDWDKLKIKRNLITFITGCILPSDRKRFLKLFDILFTMNDVHRLPEFIHHYGVVTPSSLSVIPANLSENMKGSFPKFNSYFVEDSAKNNTNIPDPTFGKIPDLQDAEIENFWDFTPQFTSAFEAFVCIQNGCDKYCTYCAVPFIRGKNVSRPSLEIIQEIESLIIRGYKSITLLGQNVTSYGFDKPNIELNFSQLLEEIGKLGNKFNKQFWIYFSAPHPKDMNEEVVKTIAKYDCLAKQFHIPLQSGDDKMLIRMNRKHRVEDFSKIVLFIKKHIPQATIFTDIIVGFTDENNEQFFNTRNLLDSLPLNMVYLSSYTTRPGTKKIDWNDNIPIEIKRKRFYILTDLLREKYELTFNAFIGKTVEMLVRGIDTNKDYLTGYTQGKLIVRIKTKNHALIGLFVKVKIIKTGIFSMEGEPIYD